jgi:hypothetical protein
MAKRWGHPAVTATPLKKNGRLLNELWGVGAAHALYIYDGHWYHHLRRFPGALFDDHGYIRFETEAEFRSCPYLQIVKDVSVPERISSIPGYIRVTPVLEAVVDAALEPEPFNPTSIDDARRRTLRAIVRRQGQPRFRSRLLRAYRSKCCITGFDAVQALEAAHIVPYRGPETDHPTNGLLLRTDLHTLFDQGLIGIDPATMSVLLAPALHQTAYAELLGRKVSVPARAADAPSKEALNSHRQANRL